MPRVQLRRYEQIFANAIGRLVARSGLSDVSDTSGAKNLMAATAREVDEAYYQMTRLRDLFDLQRATGEDLEERAAEIAPGTIQKLPASFAIGSVVFSRGGTTGLINIAVGTIVRTANDVRYRTTAAGTIADGFSTSAAVPIIAEEAGIEGNVVPGSIVRFVSKPPGVDAVTNATAASQGRDLESDDSFRARLLRYIDSLSRCTPQALEFAAIGITDPTNGRSVVFAHIFEDPVDRGNVTLYIDDGFGTAAERGAAVSGEAVITALGGEEFVNLATAPIDLDQPLTVTSSIRSTLTQGTDYFVNPASGQVYFTPALSAGEIITADYTPFINLIPTVQNVIDGDPADRANFPGFRAAGVLVRVLSPTVRPIDVVAVLTLDNDDRTTAVANAQAAVEEYINNLGISNDVVRNELIERIMGVSGVVDVDLVLPANNITILDDVIPRVTTAPDIT